MSDTPRTDARRGFHGWYTAVDAEFSEKLERELNAAQDRIKRLEEIGSELMVWVQLDIPDSNRRLLEDAWRKAMEDKL